MQITFQPTFFRLLAAFLALFLLLSLAWIWQQALPGAPQPAQPSVPPDQQAALAGVQAFYSLDFRETSQAWLARVCALSTRQGCQVIRAHFAPAIQHVLETHRPQTTSQVTVVRRVEEQPGRSIWLLQVRLTRPWPGLQAATQPVYAEVALEDGRWLLQRILFAQEAARFAEVEDE